MLCACFLIKIPISKRESFPLESITSTADNSITFNFKYRPLGKTAGALFIWTQAVRFGRTSCNQRVKVVGRPLEDVENSSSLQTRSVEESYMAALWLGGLEAVANGLRDFENVILAAA